jgi:hypothetical protein
VANTHDFDRREPESGTAGPMPLAPVLRGADALADLALYWTAGPIVLVSPTPICDALVRYSDRLFDRSSTTILVPPRADPDLAGAAAGDEALVREIVEAALGRAAVLRPWGAVPGVYNLIGSLTRAGIDVDASEVPLREDLGMVRRLDSKVGFRHFVNEAPRLVGHVQMPTGTLCQSIAEVVSCLAPLLRRDGRAVVKAAMGTAGSGVIVVDAGLAGSSALDLRTHVEMRIAQRPRLFHRRPYVVEEFVGRAETAPDGGEGATFVTVFIHGDGTVDTLGPARELRNVHNRIVAVEVGKDAGPENSPQLFESPVRALGAAASAIGYRGNAVFDFLLDSRGRPKVIEMNPRRGTAGFVFALARALFGPDWPLRLSGLIRLPVPVEPSLALGPERVLEIIETANQRLSGDALIVPVGLTWLKLRSPGVAVVTFAPHRAGVTEAESLLIGLLGQVEEDSQ